ncbi:MAG: aminotransferase class V-fold PLP-dependent enzyme [Clostridiaceae bacterium]
MSTLENYFEKFRKNTIGYNYYFPTCYGFQPLHYFDWVASGRLYGPIEKKFINEIGPLVGNTHSESSITGCTMTKAYNEAKKRIKDHVNASNDDVIINTGFGMTSAINKLQRILSLRINNEYQDFVNIDDEFRPVVFITHMEHHSNHTSWLETIADVVIVEPNEVGYVDLNILEKLLKKYKNRRLKIGSFTACSNVTGLTTPYHHLSKLMHLYDGICFVDFSASAPYVKIDMHPSDPLMALDAITFSPHKFLGGPGSSGLLIFNKSLYFNRVPDQPGGGTVIWTSPYEDHKYVSDIETREDGGTPGFLQCIKTALTIELKDRMSIDRMLKREEELLKILFNELEKIPSVIIYEEDKRNRLGIVSINIKNIHYNLVVKLLNDRFGIQTRGGCSCAGTYGHYLLDIDRRLSRDIFQRVKNGDLSIKPGWIRISLHPIMTNEEVYYLIYAIKEIIKNISVWKLDYRYLKDCNEFINIKYSSTELDCVNRIFDL